MEKQLTHKAYLSTLEVDNSRGSSVYCTLTSNVIPDKEPLVIELNLVKRRVEIAGIELTNDQRKLLIQFLKQKNK